MRINTTRLAGITLLLSATWGLGISVFGIYGLWYMKPMILDNVRDVLALAVQTIEVTDGLLLTTSKSLTEAGHELVLMQKILLDTSDTISHSTATVDEIAILMGEKMPVFISETQQALAGTQSTARLIDDTLGTFVSIPLIGPYLGQRYKPEIPLSESIANVNQSLDPLSNSFKTIQSNMNSASAGMETVRIEVNEIAFQVGRIKSSLEEAKNQVDLYLNISADIQNRLNQLGTNLPVIINNLSFGIAFVLTWLCISQLGSLLVAIEFIRGFNPE